VADVLGVAAFEVSYPVAFFVLVEPDDFAVNAAVHSGALSSFSFDSMAKGYGGRGVP